MQNQVLINYIIQQLNSGFKQDAISRLLINNGYKQQDVLESLNLANTIFEQQKKLQSVQQSTSQAVQQFTRQPALQSTQPSSQNQNISPQNAQQQNLKQQQFQTQQIQAAQPQIPQANPQLVSYITQQRNSGFSQEQIKGYLLKYGYQQQQVEPAIDSVFHPNSISSTNSHITHLGAVIVSVIVLVSVFSGAGIFFFFNNAAQSPELLDYRLDVAKKLFNPGETLIFEARMDKAAGDKFDVMLTHTIYDQEDNEIESVDETVAAEPRIASKMELPDSLKPGKYKLVSVGIYGKDEDQEVQASFNFEVKGTDSSKGDEEEKLPNLDQPKKIDTPKKIEAPTKPLPQQPNLNPPNKTQPSSQTSQQVPQTSSTPSSDSTDNTIPSQDAKTQPDEDEQKVSIDKIEADVRVKAADPTKVSEADSLCQTLAIQNEKDYCYSDIAEVSKQKQYCDKISHQYRRDVCYLNNFMEKGDYSVCDVIIDIELNLACKEQAKRVVSSAPVSSEQTTQSSSSSPVSQSNTDNTASTTNTNTTLDNQTIGSY